MQMEATSPLKRRGYFGQSQIFQQVETSLERTGQGEEKEKKVWIGMAAN